MSSHLLSEIERVCEHLVVIDTGRLVQSDRIVAFTGRTQIVTVEVDGSAALLAGYLRERGIEAREGRHALELDLADESAYDVVRDGAAALGLGLVRVEQGRHRLEDLFRDEAPEEPAVV
jgi:ABC-2 type transport system ATP-binding protein